MRILRADIDDAITVAASIVGCELLHTAWSPARIDDAITVTAVNNQCAYFCCFGAGVDAFGGDSAAENVQNIWLSYFMFPFACGHPIQSHPSPHFLTIVN